MVDDVLDVSKKEVTALRLRNLKSGESWEFPTSAMFLGIGHIPNAKMFEGQLETDADGYLVTTRRTSLRECRASLPAATCRTAAIVRRSPPLARAAWRRWKWRSIWKKKASRQLPVLGSQFCDSEMNLMARAQASCSHLGEIRPVKPSGNGCKECLEMGDTWVHLRECLSCGHIGCCDSSKNKHATKHFHQSKHPIVRSFEPGEDWRWCYVDEVFLD